MVLQSLVEKKHMLLLLNKDVLAKTVEATFPCIAFLGAWLSSGLYMVPGVHEGEGVAGVVVIRPAFLSRSHKLHI